MGVEPRARRAFLALWTGACIVKLLVAAQLPLFVDEAFYWQEGRHLAPAYSDLPGMTAWLARLGTFVGGEHALALRMPFLLLGAMVPWWVMRIGARWFGAVAGWHAGSLAVLMPLGNAATAEGYIARLELWCQQHDGQPLSEAGVFAHVLPLDGRAPIDTLRRIVRVGEAHV